MLWSHIKCFCRVVRYHILLFSRVDYIVLSLTGVCIIVNGEVMKRTHAFFCFLFFCCKHLLIPFGKFGPPYLGKAVAAARAALPMQSYNCMLDLFRVSVIHRTLTWTPGSLTCVRDHSLACIYTQGLGTSTAIITTFLTRKNSLNQIKSNQY